MFIDFALIKERITIEQVAQMLALQMKAGNGQLRSACPACKKGGDRALVITPAKAAYFCFGNGKGGDMIALAAHILGCGVKEAAQQIAQRFGLEDTGKSTSKSSSLQVPESETAVRPAKSGESSKGFSPLTYLEPEHEAVSAVGFDPEIAKELGIGYAPKGILRGSVAVPIRNEKGELQGYIGIQEAKLPPSFMGKNIVSLKTA